MSDDYHHDQDWDCAKRDEDIAALTADRDRLMAENTTLREAVAAASRFIAYMSAHVVAWSGEAIQAEQHWLAARHRLEGGQGE